MARLASMWLGFGAFDERGTRYTETLPDEDIAVLERLERLLSGKDPATMCPDEREKSVLRVMTHIIRLAARSTIGVTSGTIN